MTVVPLVTNTELLPTNESDALSVAPAEPPATQLLRSLSKLPFAIRFSVLAKPSDLKSRCFIKAFAGA